MILDPLGILAQLPNCVFWKNTRSEFLGCNQQFARYAGLPDAQAIRGITDFELPWQEFAREYREGDQKIFDGVPFHSCIETILHTNGQMLNIYVNKTPLYDQHGQVMGVIGSFTAISTEEIQSYQNRLVQQKNNLTSREKDIAKLILMGKTCKNIASLLQLSFRTVENHLANIKDKLQVSSKSELIEKLLNQDGLQ